MKNAIIVTNDAVYLNKRIKELTGDTVFCLLDGMACASLISCVSSIPGAIRVDPGDLMDRESFLRSYSAFICDLNKRNASRQWWALSFTSKHPYITGFFSKAYGYIAIVRMVRQFPGKNIIILTSDRMVALAAAKRLGSISESVFLSVRRPIRHCIMDALSKFLALPYSFFRLASRKILEAIAVGISPDAECADMAILTQFEDNSFVRDGTYEDVYFRSLPLFLKKEGRRFIICGYGVATCRLSTILRYMSYKSAEKNIYPLEYFIKFSGIFACMLEAFRTYLKRRVYSAGAVLYDEDLSWLIRHEITGAFLSGEIFFNMSVYYSAKEFFGRFGPRKVVYPFENRSWEKMAISACRESGGDICMFGYQHASLTRSHANFMFERGEFEETPHPDAILTTGRATRDIMASYFGFPENRLVESCDLRGASGAVSVIKPKPVSIKNLTVIMSLGIPEHVKTLEFLDKAFGDDARYRIALRVHPVTGAKKMSAALKIRGPDKMKYGYDDLPLKESIMASDAVLYTASSVPFYAIRAGVPVIYLDLGSPLEYDPLFDLPVLKWRCSQAGELSGILREINAMSEVAFRLEQEKARIYQEKYCSAVDEASLRKFL